MSNVLKLILCTAVMAAISSSAHAALFEADFNASTAVSGTLTANATLANLNAGTATGSWLLSNAEPGAIIGDGSGDNAFVYDTAIAGGATNKARGLLTSNVPLTGGGDVLSMEFDILAARQGTTSRQVRFSLDSATNTKAYVLIFRANGKTSGVNTKSFTWLNTSNGQEVVITNVGGPNTGFLNPAVDSYPGSANTIGVKIDVSGATTLSDTGGGPPTTGAKVTIDWDNDGVIEAGDGDVADFVIGPRNGGISDINSFEIFLGGSGNRGAYIDNIVVTPEPASLALIGLGGLMMTRRRKA